MIKYNFAKNYTLDNFWDSNKLYESINSGEDFKFNINSLFLNNLLKFPLIKQLVKNQKILYLPSSLIVSLFLCIEIISIPSRINIMKFESSHFEYIDKVNKLNTINRALEENYNLLLEYSSLFAKSSPDSLFAHLLQSYTPNNFQFVDYTVDNQGFKINAIGKDLDTVNQFISNLIVSDIIDRDSVKLVRLTNLSSNAGNESMNNVGDFGSSIEILGKWSPIDLTKRIQYSSLYKNKGLYIKLSMFKDLLEIFHNIEQ
tara:strand:+ start:620 stop:1393 length:774 start_codon:yes stop_codon:yes gene_type:complete